MRREAKEHDLDMLIRPPTGPLKDIARASLSTNRQGMTPLSLLSFEPVALSSIDPQEHEAAALFSDVCHERIPLDFPNNRDTTHAEPPSP